MGVTVAVATDYSRTEILQTLREAIRNQLALARRRFEQFDRECKEFEKQCGMSSEEFLKRFEGMVQNRLTFFPERQRSG